MEINLQSFGANDESERALWSRESRMGEQSGTQWVIRVAATVDGAPLPHDSALTSAGAELFLTTNWSVIGKFDGEFALRSQTYAGTGTLRYTW
jgi:uncharacterized protein with beta-barrel porin domain